MLALCACACTPGGRTVMQKSVLYDKIKGAWAGQTIGCTYGSPTEFKYGQPIPDDEVIPWSGSELSYYFNEVPGMYDDIYMDLTFVDVLDRYGLDAPAELFAKAFAEADYQLWHANQEARYNILNGMAPPESGYWMNNPHADDIDFQIESDFAGLMCPGMPSTAADFCDRIGHIMNYGDGWYGGVFISTMYSLAFVSDDIVEIVESANDAVPEETKFHKVIDEVLSCYKIDPEDWKKAWWSVEEKFGKDIGCPSFVFDPRNIDAAINSAYVAVGLLYGGGDFGRSIDIATRCGQDSDCNPASVGGILGTIIGYNGIPDEWLEPLHEFEDVPFCYTDISLEKVYGMSYDHALKLIKANGGGVKGDEVRIKVQDVPVLPYEQCFEGLDLTGREEIGKRIQDVPVVEFEGCGVVVKYWFDLGPEVPQDYVAEVEITLDGASKGIMRMPVDELKRKLELYYDYDMAVGEHQLGLEWTNPRGDMDIRVSSLITYGEIENEEN